MSPLRRLLVDIERGIYGATHRLSQLLAQDDRLWHDHDRLVSDDEPAWDRSPWVAEAADVDLRAS